MVCEYCEQVVAVPEPEFPQPCPIEFEGHKFPDWEVCMGEYALAEAHMAEIAKAEAERIRAAAEARGELPGSGFVYVLINAAMPGLVKVGKTEREPGARAQELSSETGIPTPFAVAYDEWFEDCAAAERHVHALLESSGRRVADNREFFCVSVKFAIDAIMKAKVEARKSKPPCENSELA